MVHSLFGFNVVLTAADVFEFWKLSKKTGATTDTKNKPKTPSKSLHVKKKTPAAQLFLKKSPHVFFFF